MSHEEDPFKSTEDTYFLSLEELYEKLRRENEKGVLNTGLTLPERTFVTRLLIANWSWLPVYPHWSAIDAVDRSGLIGGRALYSPRMPVALIFGGMRDGVRISVAGAVGGRGFEVPVESVEDCEDRLELHWKEVA
jgi:hypothetical protein